MAPGSPEDCTSEGTEAWLWPEEGGVRWWTPTRTRLLKLVDPCAWGGQRALHELRDRRDHLSLTHGLAAPLGQLLDNALAAGNPLYLHLSRDLPAAWQSCPYEWFSCADRPLFGSLLAVRQAPVPCDPIRPVHPSRPIAVLNLLGPDEPIQPADALPAGMAQMHDGFAAAEHLLNQADVSAFAALIVIAHGTEMGGDRLFRLPNGACWGLPSERGLPPLVILLACGNDQGNLMLDGRRLLEAGAQTLLTPTGRPCPRAIGEFLGKFLPRWRHGERVDRILLTEQQPDRGDRRGACLLQLMGRGDLCSRESAGLDHQDDIALARLARSARQPALAVLIDRLTLSCLQRGEPLDQAQGRLRELLQVPCHDQLAEQRLLGQIAELGTAIWPISQTWIRPLEALLAPVYLLRAYAAWAWRTGDGLAWHLILGYQGLLEARLYSSDAGPPGLVFAFMHLAVRNGFESDQFIPAWQAIEAPMEQQRYFLELAALSALTGDSARTMTLLDRVQTQRTPIGQLPFPRWLGNGVLFVVNNIWVDSGSTFTISKSL